MEWFLARVDLSRINHILAVGMAQKQTGVVKRRVREFDLEQVRPVPPVSWTAATPQTKNAATTDPSQHICPGDLQMPADYTNGVKVLMTASRQMVGMGVAETNANLRDYFYKTLSRRSGERVIDWMSRLSEHTSNTKV